MRSWASMVLIAGAGALLCAGVWSCDEKKLGQPGPPSGDGKPAPATAPAVPPPAMPSTADAKPIPTTPQVAGAEETAGSLLDQIARGLTKSSPKADPADMKARDAAADALGRLNVLMDTADAHVMWGKYDPAHGSDLDMYRLMQLPPLACARLYLSTFMFGGKHEVRTEGDYTVLEIEAKFRDKLAPGEYPHPFWNTPEEWRGYQNAVSLVLIFSDDRLAAALYKDGEKAAGRAASDAPKWDGRWRWVDVKGVEQPRVAQYSYMFSKDNPHAADLDRTYKRLETAGMVSNCAKCHGPDRAGKSDPLVLLIYPSQAIAARHSLAAVLREDTMPPGDVRRGIESGINNQRLRDELIGLADEFEKHAEAALKYEEEARMRAGETGSK